MGQTSRTRKRSRGHVHAWRLVSPHHLGTVTKYECTSCPETKEVRNR